MKPSIPKGTRDFSPQEMVRRNYIFDTIKHVYQKYGYVPIETPAMEDIETLTGKYGDEGDKLIFKILNSGSFWEAFKDTNFPDFLSKTHTDHRNLINDNSKSPEEKKSGSDKYDGFLDVLKE